MRQQSRDDSSIKERNVVMEKLDEQPILFALEKILELPACSKYI